MVLRFERERHPGSTANLRDSGSYFTPFKGYRENLEGAPMLIIMQSELRPTYLPMPVYTGRLMYIPVHDGRMNVYTGT